MAWKSTTFRQAADGRFVTKGDPLPKAAGKTGNQAIGAKAAGGKTGGWAVKVGASGPPKTAGDAKQASSQAVEKHRNAMSGVILEAKKIAKDRRETLNSIKDPDLKRSAAR
jgi:hypothetical protein